MAWHSFLFQSQVDVQQVIGDGFEKQAIRDELNKRRILEIKRIKSQH